MNPEGKFNRLLRAEAQSHEEDAQIKAESTKLNHEKTGRESIWNIDRDEMKEYFLDHEDRSGRTVEGLESVFPGISKEVQSIVDAAHDRGRKVIMADIAGQASGVSLGADVTICLTLSGRENEDKKVTEGNIYRKTTQLDFLSAIDSQDGDLVVVVMNPVGGLGSANDSYTAASLERFLPKVYERMAKPSIMILSSSHIAPNEKILREFLDDKDISYEFADQSKLGRQAFMQDFVLIRK